MKVKDLLKNIEDYRKKYPDIDNWEVYTEQPDLIAPENGMSHKEWLSRVGKVPNVFFQTKKANGLLLMGLMKLFVLIVKKKLENLLIIGICLWKLL